MEINFPPRALVIEDDPAQCADAWGLLEALGFHVSAAESAEAAFVILQNQRFDLILTDNILPGATGLQSLPKLLAAGSPVLLMSSQCCPELEKDSLLLGAAAFLRKPLTAKNMTRALKQARPSGSRRL